jgi:hypothetical protein
VAAGPELEATASARPVDDARADFLGRSASPAISPATVFVGLEVTVKVERLVRIALLVHNGREAEVVRTAPPVR